MNQQFVGLDFAARAYMTRERHIEELKELVRTEYAEVEIMAVGIEDLVFEERVRLKCLHCPNYGVKWTCPGKLPQLDFRKILNEYDHAAVVISKVENRQSDVKNGAFRQAANTLHKAMLYMERELFKRNHPMAEAFIGCNCQLCKDGCPVEGCAHPAEARLPWDATGCNVVKTLEKVGVHVVFPPEAYIYQYGLLVW